jgi:hypothetical protein
MEVIGKQKNMRFLKVSLCPIASKLYGVRVKEGGQSLVITASQSTVYSCLKQEGSEEGNEKPLISRCIVKIGPREYTDHLNVGI